MIGEIMKKFILGIFPLVFIFSLASCTTKSVKVEISEGLRKGEKIKKKSYKPSKHFRQEHMF